MVNPVHEDHQQVLPGLQDETHGKSDTRLGKKQGMKLMLNDTKNAVTNQAPASAYMYSE
jgi:hypothetical protein